MSDTPAETSAASARVANPVKPLDPIMGKFFETIEGSGNWNARLGGKPKSDWSGIDDTDISAGTVGSSLRYRPLNPARDQTGEKDLVKDCQPLSEKVTVCKTSRMTCGSISR